MEQRADRIIEKKELSNEIQIWHCSYQGMSGTSKVCRLWPGIILGMNDFVMYEFPSEKVSDYRQLKVNFCMEGRCEVRLKNNRYVYLGKNTLSIDTNQEHDMFCFPEGHYKGIELIIDFSCPALCELSWMQDLGIDLHASYQALNQSGGSRFGVPSKDTILLLENAGEILEKTDSCLYDLRLTVLRLLRVLLSFEEEPVPGCLNYLTAAQRALAQKTYDAVFNKDFSVTDFARQSGVSASSLENYFRRVYGSSIYRFRKNMQLEKAKELLATHTDLKVSEIAMQCGYRHAGKFAEVFRDETGLTPGEYRRAKILSRT